MCDIFEDYRHNCELGGSDRPGVKMRRAGADNVKSSRRGAQPLPNNSYPGL